MAIIFLYGLENLFCCAHLKRLNETLQMSTNNICFHREIKKVAIKMYLLIKGTEILWWKSSDHMIEMFLI